MSTLSMGQLLMRCEVICIAQTSSAPPSILEDPAKLTDLARELNVVRNQKIRTLDSLPRKPSE